MSLASTVHEQVANLTGFNLGFLLAKAKPDKATAALAYADQVIAAPDAATLQAVLDMVLPTLHDPAIGGLILYNVSQLSAILGMNLLGVNVLVDAAAVPLVKAAAVGFKAGVATALPK